MTNLDYSKKVLKTFLNPKNMGEMKNPDATGKIGNPVCGDIMEVSIKVDKKTDKIKDIKFKTFGCAAAISTSSMLTQIAKGKTLKEAEKLNLNDVKDALKGLPQIKVHCSAMSIQALKKAIESYREKSKKGKR